ncbi:Hypothetical protein R9X50_00192800 [Acrodontium crateriforme]|uniref:Uncharacterized protein n=1 Tax=Acrodontium crateriforme TaxID=150365 RepID=A0AAQ3M0J9_9PEZI|nr:Hypothetical protein R9X50_00192800 [Acrodontium crateriforme]
MAASSLGSGLLNHDGDNPSLRRGSSAGCMSMFKSRFVWLASAAIAIVTTKYLLAGEINYPLHLLLIHSLILTLIWFIHNVDKNAGEYCLAAPEATTAILRMAYHLSMCASFILAYLSIYHFSSLPVAMFVLTLDWQPATLLSRIRLNQLGTTDLLRYALFACGLTFIFVNDYRLHPSVQNVALAFLAVIGCAELSLYLLQNPEMLSQGLARRPFSPLSKVLPTCLLIPIGVLAFQTEYWRPTVWIPLAPTGIVLAINVISTTVAVMSGGFLLRPVKLTELSTICEPTKPHTDSILLSVALTGVVSLASSLTLDQPAVLSTWQFLGYIIATLAFVTTNDLDELMICTGFSDPKNERRDDFSTKFVNDSAIELLPFDDDQDQDALAQTSGSRRSTLGLLILGGLSWLAFVRIWYNVAPPSPDASNTSLDQAFHPRADFDIVVARYDEPSTDIAQNLNLLLQAPRFQTLQSRIHFYNKNLDTTTFADDIEDLMNGLANISVTPSENIGRESEAYLHHIVSTWDDLAAHTLFMQAEPHDFKLARNQMEQYLLPETGFMPLAYEGAFCRDCNHCHDHSWSENPAVLSALYSNANSGAPCKDLVLTYRGQFVASAARIRGNEKAMYEGLLEQLRNPNSSMHSASYTPSEWNSDQVDSMNAPTFGFTLERLWGVLMQCSDLRLAYWTPSMLGAYVRPSWLNGAFPAEDLQCLDRPIGV